MSPMANETGSLMPSVPFSGHHKETGTVFKHYTATIPTAPNSLLCQPLLSACRFHGVQQAGFSTATLGMTKRHREHPRGQKLLYSRNQNSTWHNSVSQSATGGQPELQRTLPRSESQSQALLITCKETCSGRK